MRSHLDKYATSLNTKGLVRQFKELLGGRFRLTEVVPIDHKDDGNDVAAKGFDYSQKTIEELTKYAYRDALIAIDMQLMKDRLVKKSDVGMTGGVNHRMEKPQKEKALSMQQNNFNIRLGGQKSILYQIANIL
jgi:hypothetical protein